MNYKEFKNSSKREDDLANDNAHFFGKYFATQFAFAAYKCGLSPNLITFLFLLCGLFSAFLLYNEQPIYAYLAWRLHIILDMADGIVARATKVFSKSAQGFDRSNHIVINTAMIFSALHMLENIFVIAFLIIAFYLNYFFSRNFYTEKQQTQKFSISTNIIKNIIGFEGFILIICFLIFFELEQFALCTALIYSCNFLLLFLFKLYRFNKF